MSTSTKRPHAEAVKDAEEFKKLFEGTYHLWKIAGSVRRGKELVGDVEHVVMPRWRNEERMEGNLVWRRLEELTFDEADLFSSGQRPFQKHVYLVNRKDAGGTPAPQQEQHRWGELYRGVDFRGFAHEIFMGDILNWGSVLAIRTGPAEYSKMLVTSMLRRGNLRQQDGYVRYSNGEVMRVTTEEDFFEACGVKFCAPGERK